MKKAGRSLLKSLSMVCKCERPCIQFIALIKSAELNPTLRGICFEMKFKEEKALKIRNDLMVCSWCKVYKGRRFQSCILLNS